MSGTVFARLAAAVFLAVSVVVAIIELSRQGEEARVTRPAASVAYDADRGDLRRCQALGEAALEDPSCLELWAETRRRFLTTGPASGDSE